MSGAKKISEYSIVFAEKSSKLILKIQSYFILGDNMKPLFVSFTKSNWDTCLTKCADRSRLQETFREMIEYMLDPSADELNPGYTAADSRLLEVATRNYEEGQRDPNFGFEAAYIGRSGKPGRIKLDDIVSSPTDIIHEKEDLLEGTGKFEEIQLVYNYKEVGGGYVLP